MQLCVHGAVGEDLWGEGNVERERERLFHILIFRRGKGRLECAPEISANSLVDRLAIDSITTKSLA